MLLNYLNQLVTIVRDKGMIYFLDNIDELDNYIYKLKKLKNINSIPQSKILYYTLLELIELLQEYESGNLDYEIKQLENKFLDYNEVVIKSLI